MGLKERVYSVLNVSASEKLNTALLSMLPEARYTPVMTVGTIAEAERVRAERSFDFVLVNSPLPDGSGIDFAIDSGGRSDSVVLLFVRAEQYDSVRSKTSAAGVFTLSKPFSGSKLNFALDWMASTRERIRALNKNTISLEEKMEEIRLVNRAKWLLISELKMDESAAHRYIEKLAMDRCAAKRKVAEEIINTYGISK